MGVTTNGHIFYAIVHTRRNMVERMMPYVCNPNMVAATFEQMKQDMAHYAMNIVPGFDLGKLLAFHKKNKNKRFPVIKFEMDGARHCIQIASNF